MRLEDLDEEKFIRQLEAMERQEKIITEQILCPTIKEVLKDVLTGQNISTQDFMSVRNSYDIQHVTDQMDGSMGEYYTFEQTRLSNEDISFTIWKS